MEMMTTMLDARSCYEAMSARDRRFDGRFYTAVVSTGIFCRPVCPARTPKFGNCAFYPSAAAGFRPCLRCRPELAPGLAGWRGTANTVKRALELISEGALDGDGGEHGRDVESFAERLGVSGRHLRRLFDRHLGASPLAVAKTHRLLFAKKLLSETSLSIADIASASGFGSQRRFNKVIKDTWGKRRASFASDPKGRASESSWPTNRRSTGRFFAAISRPAPWMAWSSSRSMPTSEASSSTARAAWWRYGRRRAISKPWSPSTIFAPSLSS